MEFGKFFTSFIAAALWSSTNDNGDPLDAKFSIDDFDPESLETLKAFARVWWQKCSPYLLACHRENGRFTHGGYTYDESAGHDLWLTMNGHGVGFWDRTFYCVGEHDYAGTFTDESTKLGEIDLYVGDDGKIHI